MSDGRRRLQGYLLAALAAACWATGGLLAKWLFSHVGFSVEPQQLSGARATVASVLLLGYLAIARPRELRVRPRDLWFLVAFGVLGLAGVHFTYFKTISLTNVATAILLEYLAPVIVLVFSVIFLRERLTWTLPAGVALSVFGCALMVGAIGGSGLEVSPEGIAWGLGSAGFFALYSLMGKYAAGRFSPWQLLAYGLTAAAVFWLLPMGTAPEVVQLLSRPTGLLAVTAMAVVSTVIPFGAFLTALTRIEATKATVTATLEPVLAGLGAYLLFGEALSPLQLLGGALVVLAIVVVQGPSLFGRWLPPAQ